MEKYKQTLENAIAIYGAENQIEMVIEECSELIHAIQKLKRSKMAVRYGQRPIDTTIENNLIYANLCSEIADVKIMIAQCEIIFNKEMIDISVERKVERLKNRINSLI